MRRGALQDLIGSAEFTILPLQRLQTLALVTGQAGPVAVVDLGAPHPVAQRLMRDAELGRDRADRRPLRGVLVLVLEHHADGPLAQLLGVPPLSGHGSNLSRVGASRNPGTVQLLHRPELDDPWTPRRNEADLILAKHQGGPTDVVTAVFQGQYRRFAPIATRSLLLLL